ncbi:hypothetical protein [Rhodopirellula sp. SWK7]|uniref:hypothetical protein n=1 Tax=Rhodopirellula sp. SWK7 TaxID=595460 RepID=UPI0002BE2AC1|nr:hypothetical protein [Rhodopirellula sp. SWK7]EMI47091.1 secreted protein [Rhodopirellula sp. SWK7]
MKSPLLALLLIVNLLACPVRCLSCETNPTMGEQSISTGCCCSHCDQTTNSECPVPSGDECDCQNCICEGAVVESDIELPETGEFVGVLPIVRLAARTAIQPSEFRSQRLDALGGRLFSGRAVRVAYQSWLI